MPVRPMRRIPPPSGGAPLLCRRLQHFFKKKKIVCRPATLRCKDSEYVSQEATHEKRARAPPSPTQEGVDQRNVPQRRGKVVSTVITTPVAWTLTMGSGWTAASCFGGKGGHDGKLLNVAATDTLSDRVATRSSPANTLLSVRNVVEDLGPPGLAGVAHHFRQRCSWDCGIACLLMVLPGRSWEEVVEACGTESTWTVDLAFVLSRYGASFVFVTKTIGCDPSYQGLSFYSHELGRDEVRVRRLFEKATFRIRLAAVDPCTLTAVLEAGFVVVALVDLRFLRSSYCLWTYTGHYILLYGIRASDGWIRYFDPAVEDIDRTISPADLHTARTAHGTDEDLLIIRLPSPVEA